MTRKNSVLSIVTVGILMSGCTYKLSSTDRSTVIDGTQVDYSKMDQYIKVTSCINSTQREDASTSVLKAAQNAGIKYVRYVDRSTLDFTNCVIVYGE